MALLAGVWWWGHCEAALPCLGPPGVILCIATIDTASVVVHKVIVQLLYQCGLSSSGASELHFYSTCKVEMVKITWPAGFKEWLFLLICCLIWSSQCMFG